MKKRLLIQTAAALVIVLVAMTGCKKDDPTDDSLTDNPSDETVKVATVSLDKSTLTLEVNGTATLAATVSPANAANKTVTWKSSAEAIATVDRNGKVTAIKGGSATITVTTDDGGKTATCKVTVAATGGQPYAAYDVYVAGYKNKAIASQYVAVLWKNGVETELSRGFIDDNNHYYADANSVYVSDGDVYVAGYVGDDAILWKNGVAQILGKGRARSVFVSGSDVYVAGYIDDAGATLWKNGIVQSSVTGRIDAVFVSGSNVYMSGANERKVTLWKNGAAQILGEATSLDTPYFVSVSGSDVYVAGGSTLWKNGVIQTEPYEDIRAIYVSGNDVYITGSYGTWKNGNRLYSGYGSSVFVSGSDVYVTEGSTYLNSYGYVYFNLVKNDKTVFTASSSTADVRFRSVFVVEKE